jgi:predicted dehydrogenase
VNVYNGHDANGLDALLADASVDAIAFVLPITAQPDLIIKALKAGKHVISEKPIAKDVATAKALIETYEKEYKPKGLIWRVAESE